MLGTGIKFLHFYFVFNCRYFLFALKKLFPRDFCVFFKTGRRDEVEKLKKHTTVTYQPGLRQAGISINFNQVR